MVVKNFDFNASILSTEQIDINRLMELYPDSLPEDTIDDTQLAELFGVTEDVTNFCLKLRYTGLPYFKMHGQCFYLMQDVENHIKIRI